MQNCRNSSRHPRHGWAFLAVAVAILALGFGGCKKETKEGSAEPPSVPDPLEPAPKPMPVEPKAPPGQPDGAGARPAPDAKMPPGGAEKGSVSQGDIETFIQIRSKISPLQQQLAMQAQAGASQAELQKLQGQLQQQAEQIVQASGLTQERFKEIATSIQRDPVLMRQVQKQMHKAEEGAAPR